jgi:oligopeptide/dipeptide ABC transporter ATP-binding protein
LMEAGGARSIFGAPRHPYTQALLSAAMLGDGGGPAGGVILEGDPPSAIDPPLGCRFNTRCPHAAQVCATEEPALVTTGDGRVAACHLTTGKLAPRLQPG